MVRPQYRSHLVEVSCAGISLVEVLVSIGMIGILVSIVGPAVMFSRTSASKMHCQSNLRQIGIGLQSYHELHGVFPTGATVFDRLLPFVEQTHLFQIIEKYGGASSVALDDYGVSVYVCPSDAGALTRMGNTSYLPSNGLVSSNQPGFRSPLGRNYIRVSDITDGTSNTACFSERLVPPYDRVVDTPQRYQFFSSPPTATDSKFFVWHIPSTPINLDDWRSLCESSATTVDPDWVRDRRFLRSSVGYAHVMPPNRSSCYRGPLADPLSMGPFYDEDGSAVTATSLHPNLVHVLFVDGSVRRVHDGVDIRVWQAMGTRAGNDQVGEF